MKKSSDIIQENEEEGEERWCGRAVEREGEVG